MLYADVLEPSIGSIQPLKMEPIEGSETSAYNNQTPGKHPKEYIIDSKHGESLKSRSQYRSRNRMAANQTNIKNTATDIPGYEKRNKDNKEWFHEECRQLLEQTNKAKAGIFSLTNESKERRICKEKEMGAHGM